MRWTLLLLASLLPALASAQSGGRIPATGSVELAFSPWDEPESALLRVIDEARETILVQAYVFTSKRIAGALLRAVDRGLRVEVLADARMHRRPAGNVLPLLIRGGVAVALESRYAAAHNKVLIIDAAGANPVVVTGSYNFTWSASRRNAENLLILRGNPELVAAYERNWRRHRRDAQPVDDALRPVAR